MSSLRWTIAAAFLVAGAAARADDELPPVDGAPPAVEPAPIPEAPMPEGDEADGPARTPGLDVKGNRRVEAERRDRENLKREVLDDVKRELEKTKDEIRSEVAYVESEADARSYDAAELKKLKQSVNLLQIHGYFRTRGDLLKTPDLGRGADATGAFLYPTNRDTDYIGAVNMRLRLNPILHVSDDIAVYGQFDALDNVLYGSSPLVEPSLDATTTGNLLTSRVSGSPISVKRVWAEVETPFGQLAFGRKGFHFGEGMLYNDGDCLDCDYGTTFDRAQITLGPVLGGHLLTIAADALSEGRSSLNSPTLKATGNFGVPIDQSQLDDAMRLSVQIVRALPPAEMRRKLDNGELVLQYGGLFAYRDQHSESIALASGQPTTDDTSGDIKKIDGYLIEADAYAQVLWQKLRLATEIAVISGSYATRFDSTGLIPGQSLDLLQYAGILRGQYALLKQDALLIGVDFGLASGDDAPGMGARPGRKGSGAGGNTAAGDIDGRQFNCNAGTCSDNTIGNFRMNPDFRLDQLLWRNLFTTITDSVFARAELRYKPSGRTSAGADEQGIEFAGSAMYSNALNASSTPGGVSGALGVELDGAITYTSPDRFFAGVVAGALIPFSGFDNPLTAKTGSTGIIYRGVLGVTF